MRILPALFTMQKGQSLHQNSGQAFLIVVLIMVVVLTVGLSVASRTVTNLKMGSEEANSQKAFSAAEAGIEQILQSTSPTPSISQDFTTNNGSSIVAISKTYVGASSDRVLLNNGSLVTKDEGSDIWFTPFTTVASSLYSTNWNNGGSNGTFTIYWGDNTIGNPCNDAAIMLIVITGTGKADPNLKLGRYPIENGCANGTRSNSFATPSVSGATTLLGTTFPYGNTFSLNNIVFARVIPLFYNTKIGVRITAGPNFPNNGQGQLITSEGKAGSTQRQVSYFETWDTLPSAFLFSVFASQ